MDRKKNPGGSSFGPLFGTFIVANLLKRLCQVEAGSAGILNWGGPFLRACFFLSFFFSRRRGAVGIAALLCR